MGGVIFEERHIRILLGVTVSLLGLGLWAFLLLGADEPADPYVLGGAAPPVTAAPPGDPARVPLEGFDEAAIAVLPQAGGDPLLWCLLAALDDAQRARGLMGVTDLQGYSGMLFSYKKEVRSPFYMRNTPMPLSIAWIDEDGQIVSTADMAPCEDRDGCSTYPPDGPYRFAIEVPQGRLAEMGIVPGATVSVGGTCAPRV